MVRIQFLPSVEPHPRCFRVLFSQEQINLRYAVSADFAGVKACSSLHRTQEFFCLHQAALVEMKAGHCQTRKQIVGLFRVKLAYHSLGFYQAGPASHTQTPGYSAVLGYQAQSREPG